MQNPLLSHLLSQLAEPFTGEALFDNLTDLVFFLKNNQGQYVLVNQTLASRCGVPDKSALIGRTAAEVFPQPLGASYLRQDLALIQSGEALLNELELHTYPTGETGWCLTTKLPLKGHGGTCTGLVGMSRDLHAPTDDYREIAEALRQAQTRLDSPLTVEEIAQRACLSAYQLDRRIRDVFHVSANQLLLKFRMDLATQRLRDTPEPIAQIALECGYADQSAFTRQFRRTAGLSPGEYRKGYQRK
jgi:AraC-like DNA-binding protein